jgi:hypothetical protein
MALRAGLGIMNMEFLGTGRFGVINCDISGGPPRNTWQPSASIVNLKGDVVVPRTYFYRWPDLEKASRMDAPETRRRWLIEHRGVHAAMPSAKTWAEQGPFFIDCTGSDEREMEQIRWSLSNEGKGFQFLRHLQEEGVDLKTHRIEIGVGTREIGNTSCAGLDVDSNFETEIRGLYAAGDEIGGIPFFASTGALTTGWQCGENAALRAAGQRHFLAADTGAVDRLQDLCAGILSRVDGCHWKEAEHAMQYIMDAYCGDVRSEGMLQRGLQRLASVREAPFKAGDAHELARCLEVRSLIDNAEMVLTASLARKESRGFPFFKRFDYPNQDDAHGFAFSMIHLKDNRFRVGKIPVK